MSLQHVQLPNNMTLKEEMSPKDLLVYANIKRHQNSATKEAFPSIDTIVRESKISKPTVLKCIKNLERLGYITIRKSGRKNIYGFNRYEKFEVFSEEFLDSTKIDANLKAYIMTAQQLLFKDVEGFGKTTYSNTELANIINMDRHTIAKYDKILEDKGLLTIIPVRNSETGVQINEKIFHLDELGQAIIWKLRQHENDIKELKQTTSSHSKDMKLIMEELARLKEEINKINDKGSNEEIIL